MVVQFFSDLADTGALPRSGADGIAVCDWFPLELKRASPFDPIVPGFHCPAGLADGTTCEIIVCSAMRCGVSPVKKFEVRGTGPIALSDFPLPPNE